MSQLEETLACLGPPMPGREVSRAYGEWLPSTQKREKKPLEALLGPETRRHVHGGSAGYLTESSQPWAPRAWKPTLGTLGSFPG